MSIKSLFENIADAIKDKNPNITNVTPVEMPSAIRSIPSGSSTAGGVTYDNTTSRLTANNVQDAIDELAEDISTINSDLSELFTSKSYGVTVSSDSGSPLGYSGTKDISADRALYGTPMSFNARTANDNPAMVAYHSPSIVVSSKVSGTVTVIVWFKKDLNN